MLTASLIRSIDSDVKKRYVYTYDSPIKDAWRSSAKEFLEDPNYIVRDDCDGLASTCIELAVIAGADEKDLYRALVRTTEAPENVHADHMVALAMIDGEWWVFGDTLDKPSKLKYITEYDVVEVSQVSEGILWRKWE